MPEDLAAGSAEPIKPKSQSGLECFAWSGFHQPHCGIIKHRIQQNILLKFEISLTLDYTLKKGTFGGSI